MAVELVRQVLTLYRERYFDCHVLHFHEKLHAEQQITLSSTWVKTALQAAGLIAKEGRRGTHRPQSATHPTQIQRAVGQFGIPLIPAHSPQARGRMEWLRETWQGY